MAKIDKSQFSKSEWKKIREQRRIEKEKKSAKQEICVNDHLHNSIEHKNNTAFVVGNGLSRSGIDIEFLKKYGIVYGCNALYRHFEPDYLIAVDVKMINEICKSGYQNTHEVWTNPNKSFSRFKNLNFFQPAKGWSSGPTALWMASQQDYERIFILGFDYKGLDQGKKFNNVYADTMNYKRTTDSATFYGNWLKQTKNTIQKHPHIKYTRIIQPDNFCPEELNNLTNLQHMNTEDFEKIFNLK